MFLTFSGQRGKRPTGYGAAGGTRFFHFSAACLVLALCGVRSVKIIFGFLFVSRAKGPVASAVFAGVLLALAGMGLFAVLTACFASWFIEQEEEEEEELIRQHSSAGPALRSPH